jgi:molybdopterin converting factor small subunit
MSEISCDKCGANLKCLAGESAHPDNWYCPQCRRIEQLERDLAILNAEWKRSTGVWEEEVAIRQRKHEELEAKLKQVEEVRDDLATQCINDRVYHAVKMLNKALKENDKLGQALKENDDG